MLYWCIWAQIVILIHFCFNFYWLNHLWHPNLQITKLFQMDNPGKRITQKLKPNFIGTLIKTWYFTNHLVHSLFQIVLSISKYLWSKTIIVYKLLWIRLLGTKSECYKCRIWYHWFLIIGKWRQYRRQPHSIPCRKEKRAFLFNGYSEIRIQMVDFFYRKLSEYPHNLYIILRQ